MTRSTGAGRCPPSQRRHGHSFTDGKATAEYNAWSSMKRRCLNPSSANYAAYGGRGITVCQRWSESFEAFLADMGPRPDGCSLDRINNDGDYEPGNCRWAGISTQQRNKRSVKRIQFQGVETTIPDLAERFGMRPDHLRQRLRRGWSIERALS